VGITVLRLVRADRSYGDNAVPQNDSWGRIVPIETLARKVRMKRNALCQGSCGQDSELVNNALSRRGCVVVILAPIDWRGHARVCDVPSLSDAQFTAICQHLGPER
jgi:hypothetical protein